MGCQDNLENFPKNQKIHLILLKKLTKSFVPKFDEVMAAVVTDAERQQSREVQRKAISKLIEKYRVTVHDE